MIVSQFFYLIVANDQSEIPDLDFAFVVTSINYVTTEIIITNILTQNKVMRTFHVIYLCIYLFDISCLFMYYVKFASTNVFIHEK